MQPQSVYPVICTKKLDESKKFYTRHFGFETTYEIEPTNDYKNDYK